MGESVVESHDTILRYGMRCDAIKKRFEGKDNLVGAEIGVQRGRMASRMLPWDALSQYWCIDPWMAYPDYLKHAKSHEFCFHDFLNRAALWPGKVRILTLHSEVAAKIFKPGTFDFVFIDGNHRYEYVGKDILAWGPLVKTGGWLCGHDYGHEGCEGVKMAVDEIFPTQAETGPDFTWFVKRKG
jgi:hypothetical protein